MKKNFVILTIARTKSNLLVSLLKQHPSIFCHGELFNPNGIFHYFFNEQIKDPKLSFILDKKLQEAKPIDYLKQVFDYQMFIQDQVVGFKYLFNKPNQIFSFLSGEYEIKKIILLRNFLYAFTSHLIAELTNKWTRSSWENSIHTKVDLNIFEFLGFFKYHFRNYTSLIQKLQQQGQPYHLLFADDLPDAKPLNEIYDFLEITRLPQSFEYQHHLHTQNPSNIFERLENPNEVKTFFEGTILEQLLVGDYIFDKTYWIENPLNQSWIDETLAKISHLQKLVKA